MSASTQPLISLIMLLKNGMPDLRESIESVRRLKYRNFELVVQDGGSTDGSLEYLESITDLPRIKIDSREDHGIGQANNRAMQRCEGEIIGNIDADNLIEPDALDRIVEYFQENPDIGVVYGDSRIIDEHGNENFVFSPMEFDLMKLLTVELVPPLGSAYYNRSICGEELHFDESLRSCSDFDFWIRVSSYPVRKVPMLLGSTRISVGSMGGRPDAFDYMTTDKVSIINKHFSGDASGKAGRRLRNECEAGVYCWAAEKLRSLKAPETKVQEFVDKAVALVGMNDRIGRLKLNLDSAQSADKGTRVNHGHIAFAARALWKHREELSRVHSMPAEMPPEISAVETKSFYQRLQFAAVHLEFQPDFTLSFGDPVSLAYSMILGRESARDSRVIAVGDFSRRMRKTLSKLHESLGVSRACEMLSLSQAEALLHSAGDDQRVLIYWDTEEIAAADHLLGRYLPLLEKKQHLVLLPGQSDIRHVQDLSYSGKRLWGPGMDRGHYVIGDLESSSILGIHALDFTRRNNITLFSADESIGKGAAHVQGWSSDELVRLLKAEDVAGQAHWRWFTLNEIPDGKFSFPDVP